MQFLAHRGYWKDKSEKNTADAFKRALISGFGLETDLRDYQGNLTIAHDIADSASISFEQLLGLYLELGSSSVLALNIKSDGLALLLKEALKKYRLENYFVFDMSTPELLQYLEADFPCYGRRSEYEPEPVLIEKVKGLWLDEFDKHWISRNIILKYLNIGKQVCLVSPELHGRSYKEEWQDYLDFINKYDSELLFLCTDYPEEARRFFYGPKN